MVGGIIYGGGDDIKNTIRDLKKVKIDDEDRILNTGFTEYESVVRLDGKAFLYIVKGGQMFLAESVYSMGGLVADTLLTPLGEFTAGKDELNPDLTQIAQIKDAKEKRRRKQLAENERIAKAALARVGREVQNDAVIQQWKNDINEVKRFVRIGKPDYSQSQMQLLEKYAGSDETVAKIVVDYNAEIAAKEGKRSNVKLRLGKAKDASGRVGVLYNEGIGKIDPKRREEFEEYYQTRGPQLSPYMTQNEEVAKEVPEPPTIIYKTEKHPSKQVPPQTMQMPRQEVKVVQDVKSVQPVLKQPKQNSGDEMSR
jgi:hypothetical protein